MSTAIPEGQSRLFLFCHAGDQHPTTRGSGNHGDLAAIFEQIAGHGPDHIDRDVIEPANRVFLPPGRPHKPGSDACSLGVSIEKGVRGDQLGPNRAGRDW